MCVLLVEDETLIAMVVQECLHDAGYEVMLAVSGPEAVKLLHGYPRRFTAVVSDYHMPGEPKGTGLIEHARGIYPHIPSIIATGRPDAIGTTWLQKNGVHLLAKPFHPSILVTLLDTMIRPSN